MRIITVERKKSFFGCAVVYQISCDGKTVSSVRNGKTVTFEVDDNSHIIQCFSTTPTSISSDRNGNVYGGGGTTTSDVINIPSGDQPIKLFVSQGFASLKLVQL